MDSVKSSDSYFFLWKIATVTNWKNTNRRLHTFSEILWLLRLAQFALKIVIRVLHSLQLLEYVWLYRFSIYDIQTAARIFFKISDIRQSLSLAKSLLKGWNSPNPGAQNRLTFFKTVRLIISDYPVRMYERLEHFSSEPKENFKFVYIWILKLNLKVKISIPWIC